MFQMINWASSFIFGSLLNQVIPISSLSIQSLGSLSCIFSTWFPHSYEHNFLPYGTKETKLFSKIHEKYEQSSNNHCWNIQNAQSLPLTSAVLKISFDGSHFFGWTATNDGDTVTSCDRNSLQHVMDEWVANKEEDLSMDNSDPSDQHPFLPPLPHAQNHKKSRRRRRKGVMMDSSLTSNKNKNQTITIRSVVGVLKKALAKIYGNVDASTRIQVEGSSRTDRGVHALGMIALIYCIKQNSTATADSILSHSHREGLDAVPYCLYPSTPFDSSQFDPLPFHGNLEKLTFVLNRMLPHDVRIMDASPLPTLCRDVNDEINLSDGIHPNTRRTVSPHLPFHPSLDAVCKTYQYTLSIGNIHDPLRWRHVWHVEDNKRQFDITRAKACAKLFVGTHDFRAFRGKEKDEDTDDSTIRTIMKLDILPEILNDKTPPVDGLLVPTLYHISRFEPESIDFTMETALSMCEYKNSHTITYHIFITGDRFMYKMVRFLVGAIVSVGIGAESLESIQEALISSGGQRTRLCAPSHGLALLQVLYPTAMTFDWNK